MKRIITFFVLIAMLVGGAGTRTVTHPASVEGAIFGGAGNDKISVDVKFDTDWVTEYSNSVYNPKLAKFCALLSTDVYFREKDHAKGTQNRVLFGDNYDEYDFTSFLMNIGFDDAEYFESFRVSDGVTDTNDSVTLTIGHRVSDGKYDVYAVAVRGCFSQQEWCSAFDLGCDNEAYGEMTGQHPEWTNKDHLKGADVAANRAYDFIKSYISSHGDESLPDCILITGHSRGGSIANILGARFEREGDVKSYTYTYNASAVTFNDDADSYVTIFNVFDKSDFFTDPFPFEDEQFKRYGVDMALTVDDEIKSEIAELKGRDDYISMPESAADEYRSLFSERFKSRDMLTDMCVITRTYETEAKAEARRGEIITVIGAGGIGIDDLCRVSDVIENVDGSYSVTFEYCGAALLRTYAKIMAYGKAVYDAASDLFYEDELGCEIAELLVGHASEISGGHLLINSYVIAGKIED